MKALFLAFLIFGMKGKEEEINRVIQFMVNSTFLSFSKLEVFNTFWNIFFCFDEWSILSDMKRSFSLSYSRLYVHQKCQWDSYMKSN